MQIGARVAGRTAIALVAGIGFAVVVPATAQPLTSNRTNFNVGTRHNPNSTQFGLISSASDPRTQPRATGLSAREIQVGMKLTF